MPKNKHCLPVIDVNDDVPEEVLKEIEGGKGEAYNGQK